MGTEEIIVVSFIVGKRKHLPCHYMLPIWSRNPKLRNEREKKYCSYQSQFQFSTEYVQIISLMTCQFPDCKSSLCYSFPFICFGLFKVTHAVWCPVLFTSLICKWNRQTQYVGKQITFFAMSQSNFGHLKGEMFSQDGTSYWHRAVCFQYRYLL